MAILGIVVLITSGSINGQCLDTDACNYGDLFSQCVFPGCTDPSALNYSPEAGCPGLVFCEYAVCEDITACNLFASEPCTYPGCTDLNAFNYSSEAGCPDPASCEYINQNWYLPNNLVGLPLINASSAIDGYHLAECQEAVYQVISDNPNCFSTGWDATCQNTYESFIGCDDDQACNYNSNAICGDGTCVLSFWYLPITLNAGPAIQSCEPVSGYVLAEYQLAISQVVLDYSLCIDNNWDSLCAGLYSGYLGCMDELSCNYDAHHIEDDGTCSYPGCTISSASNYNSEAGCYDGSCVGGDYYIPTVISANQPVIYASEAPLGYELASCPEAVIEVALDDPFCLISGWDGICQTSYQNLIGCSDVYAINYNENSICESDCFYFEGCTDSIACNYNENADSDDGSCFYTEQWYIPFDLLDFGPAMLSCTSPEGYYLANQICVQNMIELDPFCLETFWDGICQEVYDICQTEGCLDETACNYDPFSTNAAIGCEYDVSVLGCTFPEACNYNASATCDDGSCSGISGCTQPTACNYNPNAMCSTICYFPICQDEEACNYSENTTGFSCHDQSWCSYPGCATPLASNYNSEAGCDDGSCIIIGDWYLPGPADLTSNNPVILSDDGNVPEGYILAECQEAANAHFSLGSSFSCGFFGYYQGCIDGYLGYIGCQDPLAMNYNPNALCNAPCEYLTGCTNHLAFNYNPDAGISDEELCIILGCTDETACNYYASANTDIGSCLGIGEAGCKDENACNYDEQALCDNGFCDYSTCSGCTYIGAVNYDSTATIDNGLCTFDDGDVCVGDLDNDGYVTTTDLGVFLSVFGNECN